MVRGIEHLTRGVREICRMLMLRLWVMRKMSRRRSTAGFFARRDCFLAFHAPSHSVGEDRELISHLHSHVA